MTNEFTTPPLNPFESPSEEASQPAPIQRWLQRDKSASDLRFMAFLFLGLALLTGLGMAILGIQLWLDDISM